MSRRLPADREPWRPAIPASLARAALSVLLALASLLVAATEVPPTPARRAVLRLARPADPRSLDPAIYDSNQDGLLNVLLFQSLLDITNRTTVIPNLAREWSVSSDHRTYTLRLHPGQRFSNGRPITASDHVYAMQRFFDPALPSWKGVFFRGVRGGQAFKEGRTNTVSGLRAPTPDTIEVELEEPDATFPYVLAGDWGRAVARESLARPSADCGPQPVTTGPYRVREWIRGARLRLERNPHYFRPELQHFEEIDLLIGGDETTHLMMFERGELDIANITGVGIPVSQFKRLSRHPLWQQQIEASPAFTLAYLCLNTEIPPLDNVRVRQAIACAVDTTRLHGLNPHLAIPAIGIVNPIMPGHDPSIRGHAHDPARARRLLREAGHPDGLPHPIELLHDDRQHIVRWAQAIQADLRTIGIQIRLRVINNAQMSALTGTRRKTPMNLTDLNYSLPDPRDALAMSFHSRSISETDSLSDSFYQNPAVDRLLDEAGPCAEPARRFALYHEAERIILNDAPCVPLAHRRIIALRQPGLKGPLLEPIWWYRLDRVWKEP